jgi:hypothetical protein
LDKGSTFDGAAVEHYVRFPFNNFRAPRVNKNFETIIASLEVGGETSIGISADINNGDGSEPEVIEQQLIVSPGGATLSDASAGSSFRIDAEAEFDLGCEGKSISVKIGGSTKYEEPHTVTGLTFYVSARGVQQ